jgi:hypothetical protein
MNSGVIPCVPTSEAGSTISSSLRSPLAPHATLGRKRVRCPPTKSRGRSFRSRWSETRSQAPPLSRPPRPHGPRNVSIVGRTLARLYFGVSQPAAVKIRRKAFSAVSKKLQNTSQSFVGMTSVLQRLHCNASKRPRENAMIFNVRSRMVERRFRSL